MANPWQGELGQSQPEQFGFSRMPVHDLDVTHVMATFNQRWRQVRRNADEHCEAGHQAEHQRTPAELLDSCRNRSESDQETTEHVVVDAAAGGDEQQRE